MATEFQKVFRLPSGRIISNGWVLLNDQSLFSGPPQTPPKERCRV